MADKLVRLSDVMESANRHRMYALANRESVSSFVGFIKDVDYIPVVDAVEVVRCRECKMHGNCYAENVFAVARLDDNKRFCGVGQRREEEHNAKAD